MPASAFMTRHAAAALMPLDARYVQLEQQFDAVDVLAYHATFDHGCQVMKETLGAMLAAPPA